MKTEHQITTFFERHPELRVEQEAIDDLVAKAIKARESAYAPYSKYYAGASVLCKSGNVYCGCNIESVTFTGTIHAEAMAVVLAYNAGEMERSGKDFIRTLAVVHSGDSMPCGICRESIREFAKDALIINADPEGTIRGVSCLSELLPSGQI